MSSRNERLSRVKEYLLMKKAEKEAFDREVFSISQELKSGEEELSLLEKGLSVLQKVTEIKKKETLEKIEAVVSFGLQAIFEDSSYQFKIIDSVKRKQVVYDFRVYSDSFSSDAGMPILDSRGGGLVSIVSFLLRLVILCLIDKKAERFIALDEPFSALSENYHENLVSTVKQIAVKLNVQLLVVSHQKSLDSFGDVVYELKQQGGKTTATLIRNDFN